MKIPAGVHEGQGIRVTGEGEPGKNSGPRGDLYCYVRVKQHEFLERDGNNLIAVVPVNTSDRTKTRLAPSVSGSTVSPSKSPTVIK